MGVYEKPVISVDAGMAEGVYAASGATGIVGGLNNAKPYWDGDPNDEGTATFTLSITEEIRNNLTVSITFNADIEGVWGANATVTNSGSNTVKLYWYSAPSSAEMTVKAKNIRKLSIVSCSTSNR